MVLDIAKLGARYGPDTGHVDADRALAYAAATNDDSPAYRVGGLVPPLFAVVPTWDTTMAAVHDVVPAEAMGMLVHLSQDMHFFRPLTADQRLLTVAEIRGIRSRRSGASLLVVVTSTDDEGQPVLRQYATMFIRGLGRGESGGEEPPAHSFATASRGPAAVESTAHFDDDQTVRYADASGDTNRIHVDEVFAKEMGLPGIIVHGMCTMAFCGRAVVTEMAGGDPALLRRLAVRFSRPVLPGADLVTTVFAAGEAADRRCFAFEARSRGEVVIKDGWAEIGPPRA
ncbi:MAG: MaoC family dehydratase N-terminal domain-containing protein [Actinomycetota bacterium]|nr:MaoC family dehydratase N-terminal domain-containing protein [Actinomycetota bacterium]